MSSKRRTAKQSTTYLNKLIERALFWKYFTNKHSFQMHYLPDQTPETKSLHATFELLFIFFSNATRFVTTQIFWKVNQGVAFARIRFVISQLLITDTFQL